MLRARTVAAATTAFDPYPSKNVGQAIIAANTSTATNTAVTNARSSTAHLLPLGCLENLPSVAWRYCPTPHLQPLTLVVQRRHLAAPALTCFLQLWHFILGHSSLNLTGLSNRVMVAWQCWHWIWYPSPAVFPFGALVGCGHGLSSCSQCSRHTGRSCLSMGFGLTKCGPCANGLSCLPSCPPCFKIAHLTWCCNAAGHCGHVWVRPHAPDMPKHRRRAGPF